MGNVYSKANRRMSPLGSELSWHEARLWSVRKCGQLQIWRGWALPFAASIWKDQAEYLDARLHDLHGCLEIAEIGYTPKMTKKCSLMIFNRENMGKQW